MDFALVFLPLPDVFFFVEELLLFVEEPLLLVEELLLVLELDLLELLVPALFIRLCVKFHRELLLAGVDGCSTFSKVILLPFTTSLTSPEATSSFSLDSLMGP